MLGGLGQFLPHPDICVELTDLYRPDGIPLSDNDSGEGDIQIGLQQLHRQKQRLDLGSGWLVRVGEAQLVRTLDSLPLGGTWGVPQEQ